MRMLAVIGVVLVFPATSCSGDPPCSVPTGCVHAERVQGACACTEWEIVKVEQLPVKYVVASVLYPMAGDRSGVQYGGAGAAPFQERSLSPHGARWRTRIRAADGTERIARAREPDDGGSAWSLARVTPESVALVAPDAPEVLMSEVDIPDHALEDRILVWVNPSATIETDFAGERWIRWSMREPLPRCGWMAWLQVVPLLPAFLDGTVPAPEGSCAEAFVSSLDARERAEILSYDVFFAPADRPVQSLFEDARLEPIANEQVRPYAERPGYLTWRWTGSLADADYEVLSSSELPGIGDETLLVEHGRFAVDVPPSERSYAVFLATSSPTCDVGAALLLDGRFGTALMAVSSQWDHGYEGCTR